MSGPRRNVHAATVPPAQRPPPPCAYLTVSWPRPPRDLIEATGRTAPLPPRIGRIVASEMSAGGYSLQRNPANNEQVTTGQADGLRPDLRVVRRRRADRGDRLAGARRRHHVDVRIPVVRLLGAAGLGLALVDHRRGRAAPRREAADPSGASLSSPSRRARSGSARARRRTRAGRARPAGPRRAGRGRSATRLCPCTSGRTPARASPTSPPGSARRGSLRSGRRTAPHAGLPSRPGRRRAGRAVAAGSPHVPPGSPIPATRQWIRVQAIGPRHAASMHPRLVVGVPGRTLHVSQEVM